MTTPLPALDPYLASIGESVEDLSRIDSAQPFRSTGPAVDRSDLEALAKLAGSGRRRGDVPPALVAAELVDARGKLTDSGRTVSAALSSPSGHLRIESGRGTTPLTLDIYVRSGRALVLSTRSPAALAEVPRGQDIVTAATQLRLDYVDAAYVPVMMAAWVGLAPAWSLATIPQDLPETTILGRVDDPQAEPPAGADDNLRYVWSQPWFLWTLQGTHLSYGRVMVHAGKAGHFALTQADGADLVGFRPVPSAALWLDLVSCVAGEIAS